MKGTRSFSHLNTEVHPDIVDPGFDVWIDLDIPDGGLSREGDAKTLDHETSSNPHRSVIPVENMLGNIQLGK